MITARQKSTPPSGSSGMAKLQATLIGRQTCVSA
jgi:hypothetical protein